jgi:hypothetical protein
MPYCDCPSDCTGNEPHSHMTDKSRKKLEEFLKKVRAIPPRRVPPAVLAKNQIEAAYKALAKQLHPDVGGSEQAMMDLNTLMAAARKGLGERG